MTKRPTSPCGAGGFRRRRDGAQVPRADGAGGLLGSFRTPSTTDQAIWSLEDDPYNLQLFSQVLGALGYSFPRRSLAYALAGERGVPGSRSRRAAHAIARSGMRWAEQCVESMNGGR